MSQAWYKLKGGIATKMGEESGLKGKHQLGLETTRNLSRETMTLWFQKKMLVLGRMQCEVEGV